MNKKVLGMLVLGLFFGVGGVAAQISSRQDQTAMAQTSAQSTTITSSSVTDTSDQENYQELQDEEAENQALASSAKISAEQAKQVAEAEVGGTVTSSHLESENGIVVYEVKIGDQEVKVDANDGSVLKVESEKDDQNEKQDINENENDDAAEVGGQD